MADLSKILASLHTALAQECLDRIESGKATASDLAVARQFLKDNGIDSVPKKGDPLDTLSQSLPFSSTSDDEEAGYLPN